MATTEKSIDVNVPISTVYDQWTQFEDFPRFMSDVESVTQSGDRLLRWTVRIGGIERSFDAEITEQRPEERIAWRATGDVGHAGVVTFHKLDDETTRVMLQMEMAAVDMVDAIGEKSGLVSKVAERDMKNFKEFIEARGAATGSWRGEIPREHTPIDDDPRAAVPRSSDPNPPEANAARDRAQAVHSLDDETRVHAGGDETDLVQGAGGELLRPDDEGDGSRPDDRR